MIVFNHGKDSLFASYDEFLYVSQRKIGANNGEFDVHIILHFKIPKSEIDHFFDDLPRNISFQSAVIHYEKDIDIIACHEFGGVFNRVF